MSEAAGALIGGGRTASRIEFDGILIRASQIVCDVIGEGNAIGTGSIAKTGLSTIASIETFDSEVNYVGESTGIGIGTLAPSS
jgi:hypothetical protein